MKFGKKQSVTAHVMGKPETELKEPLFFYVQIKGLLYCLPADSPIDRHKNLSTWLLGNANAIDLRMLTNKITTQFLNKFN